MRVQARKVAGGIDILISYKDYNYGGVVSRMQLQDFLTLGTPLPFLQRFAMQNRLLYIEFVYGLQTYGHTAALSGRDLDLLRRKLYEVLMTH